MLAPSCALFSSMSMAASDSCGELQAPGLVFSASLQYHFSLVGSFGTRRHFLQLWQDAQQQLFLDLGSSRTGGIDLARLLAVASGAASSRKRLGRHLARDAGAGGSTCFRENCFLHVFSLRQNSQRQKPRVIRSTMIQTLIAAQVHCRTYSLQHWLTASSHRS